MWGFNKPLQAILGLHKSIYYDNNIGNNNIYTTDSGSFEG